MGSAREGKDKLVEGDVSRYIDATCRGVEAMISFVITGVTDEDTSDRARSKFVGGGGFRVRVAQAPKNMEVSVRGG